MSLSSRKPLWGRHQRIESAFPTIPRIFATCGRLAIAALARLQSQLNPGPAPALGVDRAKILGISKALGRGSNAARRHNLSSVESGEIYRGPSRFRRPVIARLWRLTSFGRIGTPALAEIPRLLAPPFKARRTSELCRELDRNPPTLAPVLGDGGLEGHPPVKCYGSCYSLIRVLGAKIGRAHV